MKNRKLLRMTNRELSKWLSKCNGLAKLNDIIFSIHFYKTKEEDQECDKSIRIRNLNEDEWHEPWRNK